MRVILVDENQEALAELAQRIRETQPQADIYTFPTQAALDRWLEENRPVRLRVQTFGNFELFVDGQPVVFKYSRTKEIVALLINNRGAQTTNGEIIASLWEDDG
ncbi:MAG: hypothetical protein J6K94_03895, partial [Ruminiclostridium sp.]|nr:hypothetical protein [Ruminiclostridium sp.]